MKTDKLLETLRSVATDIAIETIWRHDPDSRWDVEDDSLDPNDFVAWQSEVRAVAIVAGKQISGSAYLGGTWEKFGDNPAKSNPEISGYLPQMIEEALQNLAAEVHTLPLKLQIKQALQVCNADIQPTKSMKTPYEAIKEYYAAKGYEGQDLETKATKVAVYVAAIEAGCDPLKPHNDAATSNAGKVLPLP